MTEPTPREVLAPWLHHAMDCDATRGYGEKDGIRLTPQLPCSCGLAAAITRREPLDVEVLNKAVYIATGRRLFAMGITTEEWRAIAAEYARLEAER